MSDSNFPYSVASSALAAFIDKLKTVAVPPKIDHQYLRSLGFSSSNHRAFVPLLKFIGLLDQSGVPTERYKKGLRGDDPKQIADGIRAGYKALFDVYPNAEALSATDLQKFIAANSSYGERALSAAVKTFKTLCEFGDFSAAPGSTTETLALPPGSEVRGSSAATDSEGSRTVNTSSNQGNVTINVNIALSVDATSDAKVYDAFFAAMAKHIKVLDGSA